LRDAANPIQKCFKAWEKKHPEFVSGTIHVDWHIEPSGKPTRVKIVHSDLAGLNSCVLANVKRTSFATPPGGTSHYVDHRFLFKREQK
jgi:TonB family protein